MRISEPVRGVEYEARRVPSLEAGMGSKSSRMGSKAMVGHC